LSLLETKQRRALQRKSPYASSTSPRRSTQGHVCCRAATDTRSSSTRATDLREGSSTKSEVEARAPFEKSKRHARSRAGNSAQRKISKKHKHVCHEKKKKTTAQVARVELAIQYPTTGRLREYPQRTASTTLASRVARSGLGILRNGRLNLSSGRLHCQCSSERLSASASGTEAGSPRRYRAGPTCPSCRPNRAPR